MMLLTLYPRTLESANILTISTTFLTHEHTLHTHQPESEDKRTNISKTAKLMTWNLELDWKKGSSTLTPASTRNSARAYEQTPRQDISWTKEKHVPSSRHLCHDKILLQTVQSQAQYISYVHFKPNKLQTVW